jgi:hypothetical protein
MLSLSVAGYRGGGVGASFAKRQTTRQLDAGLYRVFLEAHEMLEEVYLREKSVENVVVVALSLLC